MMNPAISANMKPRRGRPPKANRQFVDTRQALIRSGLEVLTETGYLAAGIDYPAAGYLGILAECRTVLEKDYPRALASFSKLYDHVSVSSLSQIEEAYTKTNKNPQLSGLIYRSSLTNLESVAT